MTARSASPLPDSLLNRSGVSFRPAKQSTAGYSVDHMEQSSAGGTKNGQGCYSRCQILGLERGLTVGDLLADGGLK